MVNIYVVWSPSSFLDQIFTLFARMKSVEARNHSDVIVGNGVVLVVVLSPQTTAFTCSALFT